MKLLRHGPKGHERPAALDADGRVRDLSSLLVDITPAVLTPASLQRLRGIDLASLPEVPQQRLGVPWAGMGKFVCIGLNYADHAAEAGMPIPAEPVVFMKPTSAAVGAEHPVVLPIDATKGDWEVELGVVIGSTARCVDEADALAHVAGYCVVNDVSERALQLERGGTWDKGKGCDTFGPVGPWLVTADEIADPQALDLWLDLNGQRVQAGNTRTMVFGVAKLIAYLSRIMTLYPGDLISTGTPPGVGMGMKPPRFLQPGDTMRLGVAGLGEQQQSVHAWNPELVDA
ncbi:MULTISPECIES: fumarylacetoacetate hydrolase family protein [Rubrivivax]|uniref:Fumarylacetoacetate hydrolase family protein n=1 Tax=Rubrivivax benzoatilyticus TaxID=316997 RepID=A0ABX0HUD9_9BURK|nr:MULTISPECIES: fumarylacetoacetate hydrolase family protein [Rubrivivax]EGJ10807.1 2-hydroxyhepta-2,4-diene-1, 7-dioateisomerase / 5-carboxymethyl-2-oxo-hex-3-ene-1, 7-dioatedecarboxylase [Rubrivivax benzoatilyticus JA2 = ATCC BAA-35]NHK97407.1 fumarylacetoacetate hydrolase family protein [Rubrivivax benzoatilyticus]NHL22898.1 fumarylacetoacetate hydrolase family protein [Rubrivivax benzoatilyticus]